MGRDDGSRTTAAALSGRSAGRLVALTDLGVGHEPESAMRTCLISTGLVHALSLPEAVVAEAYYSALLLICGRLVMDDTGRR